MLKEGGGFVRTGYDPVAGDDYVSGPGCHVDSGATRNMLDLRICVDGEERTGLQAAFCFDFIC